MLNNIKKQLGTLVAKAKVNFEKDTFRLYFQTLKIRLRLLQINLQKSIFISDLARDVAGPHSENCECKQTAMNSTFYKRQLDKVERELALVDELLTATNCDDWSCPKESGRREKLLESQKLLRTQFDDEREEPPFALPSREKAIEILRKSIRGTKFETDPMFGIRGHNMVFETLEATGVYDELHKLRREMLVQQVPLVFLPSLWNLACKAVDEKTMCRMLIPLFWALLKDYQTSRKSNATNLLFLTRAAFVWLECVTTSPTSPIRQLLFGVIALKRIKVFCSGRNWRIG